MPQGIIQNLLDDAFRHHQGVVGKIGQHSKKMAPDHRVSPDRNAP